MTQRIPHGTAAIVLLTLGCVTAGAEDHPEPRAPAPIRRDAISRVTVFQAGENGIHSYRIPAMVTANDGSLLLFAEGRKNSWRDKSPTDLVMKRSADGGRTWSPMMRLLDGGGDAYMDPVPLVDRTTGRILLFVSRWPARDHSSFGNTAWMLISDDHGRTWSNPVNMTGRMTPPGRVVHGFGPGRGVQMGRGSRYAGRLVVPVRSSVRNGPAVIHAAYSDDGGRTWGYGRPAEGGVNELTITECAPGRLILNRRDDNRRFRAFSDDGGATWTPQEIDPGVATVPNGCHGCVFGSDGMLFFTSPSGIPATKTHDNRARLTLHRSHDGGRTWPDRHLLFAQASGYSDMTRMKDGRLALVFESADSKGFSRASARDRWMRLDVMTLPPEIFQPGIWFQESP